MELAFGLSVAALTLLSLPLAAQNGTLKCKVDPGRAGVFLDGKYLGPAANFGMSRSYQVASGDHELKLVEPRYQEISKKISVAAGKTTAVKEHMTALPVPQPPFGRIRTPTGARGGGRLEGVAPVARAGAP